MKIPASIRLTYRNIMVNMDTGTMVFMLGLPALYLLVMGSMFQTLISGVSVNGETISYTHFLGPGIVAMQTLTAGNIGGSMLWSDRRWGMFEQLLVGPFKRTDYLLGIMFVAIIFTLGGTSFELKSKYGGLRTLEITTPDTIGEAEILKLKRELVDSELAQEVMLEGKTLKILGKGITKVLEEILRLTRNYIKSIESINLRDATLDDVFIEVVNNQ